MLITLVLRKLLASSSFAISDTLNSLIERLEGKLKGIEQEMSLEDYDTYDELLEEQEDTDDSVSDDLEKDRKGIKAEFDLLQEELSERINEKMTAVRQSILENFDEEVAARLKGCQEDTLAGLDKFSRWLCNFFIMQGAERVEPLDQWRFAYTDDGVRITYNIQWKDAERQGDIFLRKDDSLLQKWLEQAISVPVLAVILRFDHTNSPDHKISYLESHPNLRGALSVDKLIYTGFENEEHLIYSIIAEDGTEIDEDMVNCFMELPATVIGNCDSETAELNEKRRAGIALQQEKVEEENKKYFLEECAKLDAYNEDLKEGLQRELKELGKEITEKKRIFKNSTDRPLSEMLDMKAEVNKLEERRKKMRRELYEREDEIDLANERLQDEIRSKLSGTSRTEHIMTISFEIV